jgi:hypothetical protein
MNDGFDLVTLTLFNVLRWYVAVAIQNSKTFTTRRVVGFLVWPQTLFEPCFHFIDHKFTFGLRV